MSTSDSAIVAQPSDKTKPEPQSFTIRCAECGDARGTHLAHCPGVLAAGYDAPGLGAFSSTVYPSVGGNFCKHASAIGALRFYSIWGPVELHLANGLVFTFDDLSDRDGDEGEEGELG
ncbi:hypothetical protein [Glycomyces paridis]|uniref:Uncharacterized protein n=1 Tax=Glycomyces paridis TaxID=2126555 RepID=A0A4S8PFE0_9ACTN|nr:hypothetical protein [Glycomyces paridis]THV29153.1 hypothetical protein E9998_10490 [Glycomyces paridis]